MESPVSRPGFFCVGFCLDRAGVFHVKHWRKRLNLWIISRKQAAAEHNREIDNKMEAQWLQELKDRGMEVVENPDLALFREAFEWVGAAR